MDSSEHPDADLDLVLDVAALLGDELDARLLAALTATPVPVILDLLDGATDFTGPVGEWRFADETAREQRIGAIAGGRRMALHDQICSALIEATGDRSLPPRSVEAIADHAVLSVPIGSDQRAARWSIEAAMAAATFGAAEVRLATARHHAVAADDIELMVDVIRARLEAAPTGPDREIRSEAAALAHRAGQLARWDLAVELAAAASPGSRGVITSEHPDARLTAVVRDALSNATLDRRTRAVALRTAAVADYWTEAMTATDDGAAERSRHRLADEAVDAARQQTDPGVLLHALDHRVAACWGPDMWPARSSDVGEMLDLALASPTLDLEIAARGWRILELLDQWRIRLIEQEVHNVQRLAREADDPFHRWTTRKWRSLLALVDGRLDEAVELARRAQHDADAAGIPRTQGPLFGTLGVVERLRGRPEEATDLAARNLPHADLPPSWALTYAHACAITGDTVRARQHLHNVIDAGLDAFPRNMTWLTSMHAAGHAAIVLDEHALMAEVAERLAPYVGKVIAVGHAHATMGPVDLVLAELARAQGHHDSADRYRRAEAITPTGPFGALARAGRAQTGDLPAEAVQQLRAELTTYGMEGTLQVLDRLDQRPIHADRVVEVGEIVSSISSARGSTELRSGVGIRHLARLLERPGTDMHVLELVALEEGRSAAPAERGLEALDEAAIGAFRIRLDSIDEELELVDRRGDASRSRELMTERDAIIEHLGRATGRHGVRRTGASSERARSAVTKAIRRAIDQITADVPELGRHLDRHIRTGATCRYDAPEPDRWSVRWTT